MIVIGITLVVSQPITRSLNSRSCHYIISLDHVRNVIAARLTGRLAEDETRKQGERVVALHGRHVRADGGGGPRPRRGDNAPHRLLRRPRAQAETNRQLKSERSMQLGGVIIIII